VADAMGRQHQYCDFFRPASLGEQQQQLQRRRAASDLLQEVFGLEVIFEVEA
jgi:hypothetical protein